MGKSKKRRRQKKQQPPPAQSGDAAAASGPATPEGDDQESIGDKAKQGLIWTTLLNSAQTFLGFISGVIVTRLLFPEDFGLMGIATIILQFARRVANFGFTMVLVQRKDIQREHIETVFVTNLVLMGSMTALLFFGAPFIVPFWDKVDASVLTPIVMVISFDFTLKAFAGIPTAILRREMRFKEMEFAKTANGMVGIIVPVVLAIMGYGVWSLIWGYLLGTVVNFAVASWYARWFPKFQFRLWALRDVFSFGAWVYVDSFISYGINKADFFVISKLLGDSPLGFYERAFNFMSLPRKQIAERINSILFSAYSRMQDDTRKLADAVLKVTRYFSVITYPLMAWMFFAAPAMIILLYTEKWAPMIYPLQIMCLAGVTDTLTQVLLRVVLAQGLVAQRTRRRFVYLGILIAAILFGIRWGINGVAWGTMIASVIHLAMILHLAITNLPFSLMDFIRAQKSALVYVVIQIAALIVLVNFGDPFLGTNRLLMLISVTFVSLFSFFGAHFVIRFGDLDEIIRELLVEIRKFAKKLPLLNRLGMF